MSDWNQVDTSTLCFLAASFLLLQFIQLQETIANIRRTEDALFEEHLLLESHPGDGIDMLGALETADEGSGENHFKPLEAWFDSKERSIQNLTENLEKVCQQIAILNELSSVTKDFDR